MREVAQVLVAERNRDAREIVALEAGIDDCLQHLREYAERHRHIERLSGNAAVMAAELG
jgi:hypothetical protein